MSDSYFNTTGARGAQLAKYEHKARSQEDLILEYFESRKGLKYTPSQIQKNLNLTAVPITSIRRAITSLTNKGKLVKTDTQIKGPYGHVEHCWRLSSGQLRLL